MAIITVSRQLSSLGDEISRKIAEKVGYRFFGRAEIEKRILELGFPENKLRKFDEKRLGFLANLTRSRDEYLNYLVTAVLEAAFEDNCVIVGRGSFIILKDLENHLSCRFIADAALRSERLQNEQKLSKKDADKKILESENQQKNFYKGFFNFDIHDPAMFDLIVNTANIDTDSITSSILTLTQNYITEQKTSGGLKKLEEMLIAQRIANMLVFDYNLPIHFLRISSEEDCGAKKITVHGMAESASVIASAISIIEGELPSYKIENALSVSQDFKDFLR